MPDHSRPHSELTLTATHLTVPGFAPPGGDAATGTIPDTTFATVGDYQIIRFLGRGGMGIVYEAVETSLGRRVALKILKPELAESPVARAQFLREARAAAAVRSDHVVTIYAVGEAGGLPFLAMELLTGTTLENYLRTGVCSPVEVLRIGREVAAGLAAVHAAGLVHRDVKPENIWIEAGTGRVKLLDFGLVQAVALPPGLGRATTFAGTPLYASPEQVRGYPVEPRSDLFSLGSVLYRAVAGRSPFVTQTLEDTLAAIGDCRPTPVLRMNPGLPESVAGLIHRLLAHDPKDRPPTAEAVAAECLSAASTLVVGPVRTEAAKQSHGPWASVIGLAERKPAAPLRGRRGRGVVAACAVVIFICGYLIFGVINNLAPAEHREPPARTTRPAPAAAAAPIPSGDGYTNILDKNTLAGWLPPDSGKSDRWTVADGVLKSAGGKVDQVLYSKRDYGDFELEFEYRLRERGSHTTFLLRADRNHATGANALQVNLGDDAGFPEARGRPIGLMYQTGGVQQIVHNPKPVNAPFGEWNRLHVRLVKQKLDVAHNGAAAVTANLDKHLDKVKSFPNLPQTRAPIGMVSHWGEFEFRGIRIKEIP